jgi:nucleoside-diphosphate-sugar epimerase
MEKILITGGAGFLGSSLAEKLLLTGKYAIVLVDNLVTGDVRKIPKHPNCRYIKVDVNNHSEIAAIMTSTPFDYVFHYAALVGVQRTLNYPIKVLEDIKGIENVLQLSKNTGVKRFFFTSSSEIYGESIHFPQHEETTPLNSRLPYAIVKNVGEAYCRSFEREYGLPFTIFRFFNTYGPKQSIDFVISKFLRQALKGEPITLFGNGDQSRTFCFVTDNTETILNCLEKDLSVNDVLNVGNSDNLSIKEVANLIIKLTSSKSTLKYLPALTEGDMPKRMPDNSKMKLILGRPLITLEQGIQNVLDSKIFYELNDLH